MKKSTYYNETSESEADLTDSKEFVCSYVFKMRFLSENARKNSEIENGLKNLGKKISVHIKTSRNQRTKKSKKISSIEATEALGFPNLNWMNMN